MKKLTQKIVNCIMVFVMGVGLVAPAFATAPVYAEGEGSDGKAKTAILNKCSQAEDGSGGGILCIIRLVVDIMTVLIGVAGVIGIVYMGVQYLTAGGNEEKTRKAKRRLFEIILGLVLYISAYALARWLLPGFK